MTTTISNKFLFFLFFLLFFLIAIPIISCAQPEINLKLGADRLVEEKISDLYGKKIGLIVNHTSRLSNGIHLVDTLFNVKEIKIQNLFAPEHGIRGDVDAGKHIADDVDPVTGIKIVSLYGNNKKPTKEILTDVDIIIYDVQDVGSRYYTYISTLYYAIEAATENNIKLVVLDRPNPIGGEKVEGPILDLNFRSFVGITEIPIRHGMTIGELALFFKDDIGQKTGLLADIEIIEMINWDRKKYFDDYVSEWLPPSPNINKLETAIIYPGTCLLEGTNISEGRGTEEPFLMIGAPFINSKLLIKELNDLSISGISLEQKTFTPTSIQGMSASPKLKDVECNGIKITVTDRNTFQPVEFGMHLISVLIKLYPDKIKFNNDFFDKLAGSDKIRKTLLEKTDVENIILSWQDELQKFLIKRNQYLLY